jgi:hypothetical protein
MSDETWHISDLEQDRIREYVSSIVNPNLKPWVFANTIQLILNGLHQYRKKQMFLMEERPITVDEFIQEFWKLEDPTA